MNKIIIFALLFCSACSNVWAFEYNYDGDRIKHDRIIDEASSTADKFISEGLISDKYRDAMVFCLAVDNFQRDGNFKSIKYNDKDIDDLNSFNQELIKKTNEQFKSAGHPYVAANCASFLVKMKIKRAKILFNDDSPQYWDLLKEKQEPSRTYTLDRPKDF